MVKQLFSRILICMVMILLGINSLLFAENQEIATNVHLAAIEAQHHHSSIHHTGQSSLRLCHNHTKSHSHRHQHSKDGPVHEHAHSDGAVFGATSLYQISLSSNFALVTDLSSRKLIYLSIRSALPEGFPSSNIRPPIA